MAVKFYLCGRCGNLAGMVHASGVPLVCCGEKMTELIPNTVEASQEKHLPMVIEKGDKIIVNVGSAPHPMIEEHSILWIYLETEHGGQRKTLKPGDEPQVSFQLDGDKAVAVYAYCNIHGLWKTEL